MLPNRPPLLFVVLLEPKVEVLFPNRPPELLVCVLFPKSPPPELDVLVLFPKSPPFRGQNLPEIEVLALLVNEKYVLTQA